MVDRRVKVRVLKVSFEISSKYVNMKKTDSIIYSNNNKIVGKQSARESNLSPAGAIPVAQLNMPVAV